jgi:isopentenyl phosphate kinase
MKLESNLVFCKLGGSIITDKTRPETVRQDVLARLARELAGSLAARPHLRLVLGHGSGSFGHVAAQRHGTRNGVRDRQAWFGFAQVASSAARLNRFVARALLDAGIPAWSLQPSASARCRDGELQSLALTPVRTALAHGLVPLVYGDVALDDSRGGTIISTEQVLAYLARRLRPARILLLSAADGVFEANPFQVADASPVPVITPGNWDSVRAGLGGSHAADVTGGMRTKVEIMLSLVRDLPGIEVRVVSGMRSGALETAVLATNGPESGTVIRGD